MHLTLDCEFNHFLIEALAFNAASNLSLNKNALSQLLSKAVVQPLCMPLEALISTQFGLINAPDYPIAAIAAAIDGLEVADKYWLRADPVHLVLQRDCFSLGEPIPLHVDIAQASSMVATLNQHLNQDGLTMLIGESGAWYIASDDASLVETTLPSVAADKNIHSFLPRGVQAAKWLKVLNEVQMLLHDHPANQAREAMGEDTVNSIWLSGGGAMPEVLPASHNKTLILASNVFHQGLAAWIKSDCVRVPANLDRCLNDFSRYTNVRISLPQSKDLTADWFLPLLIALKNKKITQLTLNIGWYENTLTAMITPSAFYKFWQPAFWRKPKAVMHYLTQPANH